MIQRILLICILLLGADFFYAQPSSLGIQGGIIGYNGDYGNEALQLSGVHGSLGLTFTKELNKSWDVKGIINHGVIDYYGKYSSFSTTIVDFNLVLARRLNDGKILKESAKIYPEILFGLGDAYYKPKGSTGELVFNFLAGAGLNFKLTDEVKLYLRNQWHYTLTDDLDMWKHYGNNINWKDGYIFSQIGIDFTLK